MDAPFRPYLDQRPKGSTSCAEPVPQRDQPGRGRVRAAEGVARTRRSHAAASPVRSSSSIATA